jgi:4-carboxymuconolactone decarboxylase
MSNDMDVSPLAIEDWPISLSHIVDQMNGQPINVHRLMAHNPKLLEAWWSFRCYVVDGGTLGKRNAELVILRVATHMKSWYEWGAHVERAMACGITLAEIEQVKKPGAVTGLAACEAMLLKSVDEMIAGHMISPQCERALRAHFSVGQIMDIIAIHGMYVTLGCMINTWGLTLDKAVQDKLPPQINQAEFEQAFARD